MTTQAPVPGSPEYDQAMIKAAEDGGVRIRVTNDEGQSAEVSASELKSEATSSQNSTADIPQRPSDVPEKFWNAEKGEMNTAALLQSYKDNEAALTQARQQSSQQQTPPEKTEAQKTAEAELAAATTDEAKAAAQTKLDSANAEAATKAAATVGIATARADATTELQRDGKISDDTYAKLAKAGFDKATVDDYVEGLKARAEVVELKVYGEAGGKDQYGQMIEWAKDNWSEAQIQAFNAALDKNDLNVTLGAVKGLSDAYKAASGSDAETRVEPKGGASKQVTGDMFRSKEEVNAAMSDQRYVKGDKAFHAEVDRKLEASIRANIDLGF